jgi:hypothetical protein
MTVPERTTCRVSGEPLVPLFTLGKLFISDFIPPDEAKKGDDAKVELKMMLAPESGLVQLAHTAPSDDMYRRYWYRSGTNATMKKELEAIAARARELARPAAGDVWVDIGCNDGTLLSFVPKEVTRVGFDPANNTFMEAVQSCQRKMMSSIREVTLIRFYRNVCHMIRLSIQQN